MPDVENEVARTIEKTPEFLLGAESGVRSCVDVQTQNYFMIQKLKLINGMNGIHPS